MITYQWNNDSRNCYFIFDFNKAEVDLAAEVKVYGK